VKPETPLERLNAALKRKPAPSVATINHLLKQFEEEAAATPKPEAKR